MSLFQPVNIIPDVRSGLGNGVIDATQDMTVSWRITGQSAMTAFNITIMLNNSSSTQKYTTGQISTGCPAYGTTSTGAPQMFSYTIPAASLAGAGITNGNEYKLVITEWWSASGSVAQSSASVFITRKAPALSISAIGTGGVIDTRYYTFAGVYAQDQGDLLNWFRWQIATSGQTATPFFDSGNVSGTADISAYYDGFFTGANYSVRLSCQTESGVEADTGWVDFSCLYDSPTTTGGVTATCAAGTDAVLVQWKGIGSYPGTATGFYSISADNILTLGAGATIEWQSGIIKPMEFYAPWTVLWRGTLGNSNATVFTIGQNGNDISLVFNYASQTLSLVQNGVTLAQQGEIINAPNVTAVLTDDTLYLRIERPGGGLYPSSTLYPSATLYPAADRIEQVYIYSLPVSYTQEVIDSAQIGGYQICRYFEIQQGIASAGTIAEAITNGTYVPGPDSDDYMLADWTNGIDAGTLDFGGDTVIGFALYRMQEGSAVLEKIAETDADAEEVYDYGAASQQGTYTYYLFPIGQHTYISSPIISGSISPCWWNWTLMECTETDVTNIFAVLAAYRFRYNISTGQMSNNNSPSLQTNFTPYPKIQLAPQNYKSATLTGLIGKIDWASGQPEYIDTIALRDAISALSVTQNPLFLKSRKGDLIRVKTSGAITMQTDDNTEEQMQTASIPWVEVGSAVGVSLFALESKGVSP